MLDREASRTALATAYLRAAHQSLDDRPLILDDPIALGLLGKDASRRIEAAVERYQAPGARALRSHVVLRSRFAEDRLAAAVRRGVTQYVILGAGFDTFALRQPAWAASLKILEVDHPATQAMKRDRLAACGLATPANAALANVDFENESLLDGLCRHQISAGELTFFSWLGVTMYLQEAAIDAALLSMAAFPAGSEVVLTFLHPRESAPPGAMDGFSHLAQRVEGVGERFISTFEPEALEAKLLRAGFSKVEFLSQEEARERYFPSPGMNLPVPRHTGIACAIR